VSGGAFELDAGDGLVLRLNQPEHAGGIFALVDRDRDDLAHWLPWVDQTREVADSRAAIERSLEEFESGTAVALALVDDGRTVGKIGLHDIGEPEGNAELGYWLAADARGRGRMTRAARAMVGHAFESGWGCDLKARSSKTGRIRMVDTAIRCFTRCWRTSGPSRRVAKKRCEGRRGGHRKTVVGRVRMEKAVTGSIRSGSR